MARPWPPPPSVRLQRCEGCGEEIDRSAVRCADCELAIIRSARVLGPLITTDPCPCRDSYETSGHHCGYFHGSGRAIPAGEPATYNRQTRPSARYHGAPSGAPYHPPRWRPSTTRAEGPSPD